MKPKLPIALCIIYLLLVIQAKTQTLNKNFPITDGYISAVAEKDSIAFLGGHFSMIGNPTYNFARLVHARQDLSFPQVNGVINDLQSDGEGGYYIVGVLKSYGNTVYNAEILHIDKSFQVDVNFKPLSTGDPGSIKCVSRKDNHIFIGGSFTHINGIDNSFLAVLNLDGSLSNKPFDKPSGEVDQLMISDSLLITRGLYFNYVGNNYFPGNFAELNISTGKLKKDCLITNGSISAASVDSNKLYAAGYFKYIGYNTPGLAKFKLNDTVPTPGFPLVSGTINAIVSDNKGGYFVGGNFGYIGDKPISNLAHILNNGKIDENFNVQVNGIVYTMMRTEHELYIGGSFSLYSDSLRTNLAAIDIETFHATGWAPSTDSRVNTLAYSNGKIYFGGDFLKVNGTKRNYTAAVDTNNNLLSWNPSPKSSVSQLAVDDSGKFIYVAGSFEKISDSGRDEVAKIDAVTGIATKWKPNFSGEVSQLCLYKDRVYIGGSFNQVNSKAHANFVVLDTIEGTALNYQPDANGAIYNLYRTDDKLYIVGAFSAIAGQARQEFTRLDLNTNQIDNWNPKPVAEGYGSVKAICKDGNNLIVGGNFSMFKKADAAFVTAIDLKKQSPTEFRLQGAAQYLSNPTTILHCKNQIFLGGYFTYYFNDGSIANNLCAVDDKTGLQTHNFSIYPSGQINKLLIYDSMLIVAGGFYKLSTDFQSYPVKNIAAYNLQSNSPVFDLYATNGPVQSLITDSANGLIIAGNFNLVNPKTRASLAAVNINTNSVTSWDAALADDPGVACLAIKDSLLYFGGGFKQVGEYVRNNIAAVSIKTGLPFNWHPNINNFVNTIAIDSSVMYIGGSFTEINNKPRNYVASVSLKDTGSLSSWKPSPNYNVSDLRCIGNHVYLLGYFSAINNVPRNNIAEINKITGGLNGWDPKADGAVVSMTSDSTKLYLAGNFSMIGTKKRVAFASYDLNTGKLDSFQLKINNPYGMPYLSELSLHNNTLFAGVNSSRPYTINDSIRTALAAIDLQNNITEPFDPFIKDDLGNSLYFLNAQKANLYCGGNFLFKDPTLPYSTFACFTLPPTKVSSGFSLKNISRDTVIAVWVKGNGQKRILVVKENSWPTKPINGKAYLSNPVFGQGDTTSDSSYVVYNGTGSEATITGLKPNHTYYFILLEYNGNDNYTDYLQESFPKEYIKILCPQASVYITASDSTNNLCPGTNVVISAPAYNAYLWNTNDTTQNMKITSPGPYQVIVTDDNGCKDTSNQIIVSYLSCTAPVNLHVTDVTNTSVKLRWSKATCANNYKIQYRKKDEAKWTITTTKNNFKNLSNLIPGTYQWKILTKCNLDPVIQSGYSSINEFTTSGSLNVDNLKTSVDEYSFSATIFPNPAKDKATLVLNGNKLNVRINVFNVLGKSILQYKSINQSLINLPLQELSAGIYIVKIDNGEKILTLKFIKR